MRQSSDLYYIEKTTHLSMLVTGLLMLKEQGLLDFTVTRDEGNLRSFHHSLLLDLDICGKRLRFDMADGYPEDAEELIKSVSSCDHYFKRSFSEKQNEVLPEDLKKRVHKLGLHYHVSYPGNFIDDPEGIKGMVNSLRQLAGNGATYHYFTPDKFEETPKDNRPARVLFYARLWDAEPDFIYYDFLNQINEDRIKLVRLLRKEYGDRFTGGVQYSPLAARKCPELVAPVRKTQRKNYLSQMHDSDICIASTGLHESIGWKLAEYVAASKGIVSQTLNYQPAGPFEDGQNYLSYDSPEQCLSRVRELEENPEALMKMKQNNFEYYRNYLRPDRLMANALDAAVPEWRGEA